MKIMKASTVFSHLKDIEYCKGPILFDALNSLHNECDTIIVFSIQILKIHSYHFAEMLIQ